jgi:hypothetical protein
VTFSRTYWIAAATLIGIPQDNSEAAYGLTFLCPGLTTLQDKHVKKI